MEVHEPGLDDRDLVLVVHLQTRSSAERDHEPALAGKQPPRAPCPPGAHEGQALAIASRTTDELLHGSWETNEVGEAWKSVSPSDS